MYDVVRNHDKYYSNNSATGIDTDRIYYEAIQLIYKRGYDDPILSDPLVKDAFVPMAEVWAHMALDASKEQWDIDKIQACTKGYSVNLFGVDQLYIMKYYDSASKVLARCSTLPIEQIESYSKSLNTSIYNSEMNDVTKAEFTFLYQSIVNSSLCWNQLEFEL